MSVVDGLPFKEDKKNYIMNTLDPLVQEMVCDLLTEMPPDCRDYMIMWLRKRAGITVPLAESLKGRNASLKKNLLNANSAIVDSNAVEKGKQNEKDDESEEEDDDDDVMPEPVAMAAGSRKQRASVSAEAYGDWNKKMAFTPPVHTKTDDQKTRLGATLSKSFMFNSLEKKDMETITMATKEATFAAGDKVITEGGDGDCLFVIESGTFDCIKKIDGADKVVKTCNAGDVFGELALLYNCPRAASVVAKGAGNAWQLDRETFNHIVKDAAMKRRTTYEDFLKSVALIAGLDSYERSQIADALKSESYKKGDTIVKEGDEGDKFYIVEEGELYASKGGNRVMDYKVGTYFGELALLKNQPRAASIIVESAEAKVVCMSRASFVKMVGPVQALLEKQASQYT